MKTCTCMDCRLSHRYIYRQEADTPVDLEKNVRNIEETGEETDRNKDLGTDSNRKT